MDDKYIIVKRSRSRMDVSTADAYRGPTCADTGVQPGKVYNTYADAAVDAAKLTDHNPVGFKVLKLSSRPH